MILSVIIMFYIFMCTTALIIILNLKCSKNILKWKKFIIFGLLFFSIYCGMIFMFFLRKNELYLPKIEFIYECICWTIILLALIFYKKIKLKYIKKCISLFNKTEKWLFLVSLIFGLMCLIFLFLCNERYIYPTDKFGIIHNLYFNADVERAVDFATSTTLPHIIHPLYRFILLPIIAVPTLIIKLLSEFNPYAYSNYNVILGYFLCIIQIFLNAISSILFYRILKDMKININSAIFGTLIFIFSFSSVWLSIFPETYAVTLLFLLLTIYLYQKRNNYYVVTTTIGLALNPIVVVLLFPIIINEIYRFKNNIINIVKNHTLIRLLFGASLFLLMVSILYKIFIPYLIMWADINNSIYYMKNSIAYMMITWFIGPNFNNIIPYFVQSYNITLVNNIVISILLFICLLGIVKNRKEIIAILAAVTLVCAFFLHIIFGYGRYNGILYCSLYTWSAILLFTLGVDFLYSKIKKKINIVFAVILLFIILQNMNWIYCMGSSLKNIIFCSQTQEIPTKFNLTNKSNYVKFIIRNDTLIRYLDQKIILKNVNSYHINSNDNSVTGLLNDSSWFEIYDKNNMININVNGNTETIAKNENLYKQFYIFGMGLRNKYIFTKDNNGYKLLSYSDNKIIFQGADCDNIDYENYIVTGHLNNGGKFEIFENGDGIFFKVGDKLLVLDNSTKINIPTFIGNKYKKQLRILLNEVMVNITKSGPTPNFLVYPNPWYRDAAMMAMVLEKTNNVSQIENWVDNITKSYDVQNGNKEPDNLGELLYLISLTKNKNPELVKKIINDAEILKGSKSYIEGITDGNLHPVYQTRWLIYGLKRMGLDYSEYKVPQKYDSYSSLMWFDEMEKNKTDMSIKDTSDQWQYLYFAKLHYYNKKINFEDENYPLSWEIYSSKADFENLKMINDDLYENKFVVPHGWAASEMFLYLLNIG